MNFSASSLFNTVTENVKKASETSSKLFERARQYTEENFGDAQKTEIDGLQEKLQHAHMIREQTDSLHKQIQKFVNAGTGVSMPSLPKLDNVVDKIAQVVPGTKETATPKDTTPPPPAPTPYTPLAEALFKAANTHGYLTAFGKALSAIGEAERDVGLRFVDFREKVTARVVEPLNRSLHGDLKEIESQERELTLARLDLDAAKRKVRESHTADKLANAESDLRRNQYNFERIYDTTDAALDKLHGLPVEQLVLLREFVEQQRDFHANAQRLLDNVLDTMPTIDDVERETVANTGVKPITMRQQTTTVSTPVDLAEPTETRLPEEPQAMSHRARALYDYEPTSPSELELVAGEEVTIQQRLDADWVIAEQNGKSGKVPIAYLLIVGK